MYIIDALLKRKNSVDIAMKCNEECISYKQLYVYSMSLSNYIIANVGDSCHNIGLYSENPINYIIGYISILLADKCIVPIKTDTTQNKIIEILEETNIQCLLTDKIINEISVSQIKIIRFKKQIVKKTKIKNESDFLLLETSGTTSNNGEVKFACFNEKNMMFVIDSYVRELQLLHNKNKRFWILVPLQSAFGNYILLSCLICGITIYVNTRWAPWNFRQIIVNEQITHIECITTQLIALSKICRSIEWGCLEYVGFGGESISGKELDLILSRFKGLELSQGYGLTEAGPLIALMPPRLVLNDPQKFYEKKLSVGKILEGIEIKIEKETEKAIIGEILVKGPNITHGYYGRKERLSLKDGYLVTGDMGYVDAEGYLYVTGRKKNIAIIEGRNVQLEEIEHVIKQYPDIIDARVISVNDEFKGEILIAELVVNKFYESEFIKFLQTQLEKYKIPQELRYVKKINKVGGKIKR